MICGSGVSDRSLSEDLETASEVFESCALLISVANSKKTPQDTFGCDGSAKPGIGDFHKSLVGRLFLLSVRGCRPAHRAGTGCFAAFDRFDFLELACEPRGFNLPKVGEWCA
jgi:hypothetical protein